MWIEISLPVQALFRILVTPYAGVWIEITEYGGGYRGTNVTPYAGVWIEISEIHASLLIIGSLPTRECGLKYLQNRTGVI